MHEGFCFTQLRLTLVCFTLYRQQDCHLFVVGILRIQRLGHRGCVPLRKWIISNQVDETDVETVINFVALSKSYYDMYGIVL